MKIIGIYNQKGGSGKTAISINLSAFLAKKGARVLDIDCDIQSNLTNALLFECPEFTSVENPICLVDLLNDLENIDFTSAIYPAIIKRNSWTKGKKVGIDVLPSSINYETKLYTDPYLMKRLLDKINSLNIYDYVIIDFPPERPYVNVSEKAYNLVTLALASLNTLLIPCSPDMDSFTGYNILLEHIRSIKGQYNPYLNSISIVLNAVSNSSSDKNFLNFCNEYAGSSYSGIAIPYSGIYKQSRIANRPLAWFYSNSDVAIAYKKLAEFVK